MVKLAIGIDIGGTKIRGIIFDGRKIIGVAEKKYRQKPPGKREFLDALFGVIDELVQWTGRQAVRGIGLGVPGAIAKDRVRAAGNFPVLSRIDLKKVLSRRYRLHILMDNDAKAAAIAEWRLGAAKNIRSMVMLTLGTGVGGAYIKDGVLQRGAFDTAYEIGFMVIDASRARKGQRGDLEWFTSEKFFRSKGLEPLEARNLSRRGNQKMRALWQEYGEYLGIGIANIMNTLEPARIVIGGNIAYAWPFFAPSMKQIAKRLVLSPIARQKTKIVRAKLGPDAGAIGAALLVLDHYR